jgi:hypothetical protein
MELLAGIASVLTIISFVMYLRERSKRKLHDEYAVGFLHGAKTSAEGNERNASDTSASWRALLTQIDDTLEHLKPAKRPNPPASMDEFD